MLCCIFSHTAWYTVPGQISVLGRLKWDRNFQKLGVSLHTGRRMWNMEGHNKHTEPSIWKFLSHFSHLKTKSFRPGTAYLVVWLRIQHSISAATLKGPAISINDYLLWKHFWLASLIEISCMLLFIFRCSPTACQKWKTSLESALPLGPCCRMLCTPTYFQLSCMGDWFLTGTRCTWQLRSLWRPSSDFCPWFKILFPWSLETGY